MTNCFCNYFYQSLTGDVDPPGRDDFGQLLGGVPPHQGAGGGGGPGQRGAVHVLVVHLLVDKVDVDWLPQDVPSIVGHGLQSIALALEPNQRHPDPLAMFVTEELDAFIKPI